MLHTLRHPDDIAEEQTRKNRDKTRKQTQKRARDDKRQGE
jgi:hypothetical protein